MARPTLPILLLLCSQAEAAWPFARPVVYRSFDGSSGGGSPRGKRKKFYTQPRTRLKVKVPDHLQGLADELVTILAELKEIHESFKKVELESQAQIDTGISHRDDALAQKPGYEKYKQHEKARAEIESINAKLAGRVHDILTPDGAYKPREALVHLETNLRRILKEKPDQYRSELSKLLEERAMLESKDRELTRWLLEELVIPSWDEWTQRYKQGGQTATDASHKTIVAKHVGDKSLLLEREKATRQRAIERVAKQMKVWLPDASDLDRMEWATKLVRQRFMPQAWRKLKDRTPDIDAFIALVKDYTSAASGFSIPDEMTIRVTARSK